MSIYVLICYYDHMRQQGMANIQQGMQIERYIEVPTIQSTSPNHNYLSYTELLVSVLTGILIICFSHINQFVVTQSEFQVLYLLSALLLIKAVIPINYLCREKPPKTRLESEAKLDIGGLFIPSFIKSLLYLGSMMMVMYMGWMLLVLPLVMSLICVQLLWVWVQRKRHTISARQQLQNARDYEQMKKRQKRNASKSCMNIRQIFIEILLVISYVLHVEYMELVYNPETVIAICVAGSMCLVAFYYMHHQIFELYHSHVDELLAKQYPFELFNFLLYFGIYYLSSSTISSSSSGKEETSPGFLFILEYPIHTTVGLCLSILYEYLCLEIIKKSSFKYLFLTQVTGIFWFNLHSFKAGVTTSRYFSTFIALVALLMLTRLISGEKVYARMLRIRKWFRKKQGSMVEELEVNK